MKLEIKYRQMFIVEDASRPIIGVVDKGSKCLYATYLYFDPICTRRTLPINRKARSLPNTSLIQLR